jgi:hypothetical protein
MPKFPDKTGISREDALNQIISSIAMEELGLSHILNAEGEKIQYVLGTLPGTNGPDATVEDVLAVNESVKGLLDKTAENQKLLGEKLKMALSAAKPSEPAEPVKPGGPNFAAVCGMAIDTRGEQFEVETDAPIPFSSSSSLIGTAFVNHGIQVKSAGTYMVQFTIHVSQKQTGRFVVGINGVTKRVPYVYFSTPDTGFASAVSGSFILPLEANDIVTVVNASLKTWVGVALSAGYGTLGTLTVFKIA